MAWVATDKDGTEKIFPVAPYRAFCYWTFEIYPYSPPPIALPKGTIKKLIGRELDWKSEPVELKEE